VETSTCRPILGRRPGPILYNLHAADIPRRPGTEISNFSNCTVAFTPNENINYTVRNLHLPRTHGYENRKLTQKRVLL
jgi:hypothetical protein